jgi:hypothetical protein
MLPRDIGGFPRHPLPASALFRLKVRWLLISVANHKYCHVVVPVRHVYICADGNMKWVPCTGQMSQKRRSGRM